MELKDLSPYKDVRREFFAKYFSMALPYDKYIKTGSPEHETKWNSNLKNLALSSSQKTLLHSFTRKMHILIMSGTWCGDCSRQGPMLNLIAANCPAIELRFIDNKNNPELQDELRINGAEKVPVAVVLSEDFLEVSRFGDRHLSVYRRKLQTELGAACDAGILPPDKSELDIELQEWIDYLERAQIVLRLAPMLRRRHGD